MKCLLHILKVLAAAAAAKSLQSCPTLCDPIDGSPPGSPVSGILQARILEWVAIAFSNAWKWKVKVKPLSHVQLFATPWTAAYQAPPSMGFSRQEYGRGVPFPPSGDLPNPGIKPESPTLKADSLPLSNLGSPSHNHLLDRELFFFLVLSPQDFEMSFCKNYWNSLVISFAVSTKSIIVISQNFTRIR